MEPCEQNRRQASRPLAGIDSNVPDRLDIEVILDNYATHEHPDVLAWLQRHPRIHFHFTPTSSSWLNLVERWFGMLSDKALRRGVFHSVPDLVTAIEDYLTRHNDDPRPLVWTASAQNILDKIARGRVAFNQATNSGTQH
jgi:transposase